MTAKRTPATVDPLTGLAPLLRVRPELQGLCVFSRTQASPHAPEAAGWAPFHIVTRGTCVLERDATGGRVLTLLVHPATSRAVAAPVADPGRPWTLDALGRHAPVSRATLVRAFRRTVGVAPLAFLADLRLGLARHRLATSAASLGQVAAEVGYASESAFGRAFRRRFGERPRAARRAAPVDALPAAP